MPDQIPHYTNIDYVTAVGNDVANNTSTATMTVKTNQRIYLTGFDVMGLGSTTGGVSLLAITGVNVGANIVYTIPIPTGITAPFFYSVRFPIPLRQTNPGAAPNVVVNFPAAGAGSTNARVISYGYSISENIS